jgi:hypothetical protein
LDTNQELEDNKLIHVIKEVGKEFILLSNYTKNSFKMYLTEILNISNIEKSIENQIISLKLLIQLVDKYRVESFKKIEFINSLEQSYIILQNNERFNEFLSNSKILLKTQYEEFIKTNITPEQFYIKQELQINTIYKGEFSGEITNELVSLIQHIFYPNDQTKTFEQYKTNLHNWENRNSDIPTQLQNFEISTKLKGIEYTPKSFKPEKAEDIEKTKKAEKVKKEIDKLSKHFQTYSNAHSQLTTNKKQITKLQVLELLYNLLNSFQINKNFSELNLNDNFLKLKKEFFQTLYYYANDTNNKEITFMHSLNNEFDETYQTIYSYITYLQDTTFDILKEYIFSDLEWEKMKDTKLIKQQIIIVLTKLENSKNEKHQKGIINDYKLNKDKSPSKETIIRIIQDLCFNYDIRQMEKYVNLKFDIKKSKDRKLTFKLSKQKLHTCALMNLGVCTSMDSQLWNSQDFWQLIIFDENLIAHGGVMIRTKEIENKKYLSICINPTTILLSQIKSEELYNNIIRTCFLIAKKINYNGILIPEPKSLQSNRSQIHNIISKSNYKKIEFKNTIYTYSPEYSYDSAYLVTQKFWNKYF